MLASLTGSSPSLGELRETRQLLELAPLGRRIEASRPATAAAEFRKMIHRLTFLGDVCGSQTGEHPS